MDRIAAYLEGELDLEDLSEDEVEALAAYVSETEWREEVTCANCGAVFEADGACVTDSMLCDFCYDEDEL